MTLNSLQYPDRNTESLSANSIPGIEQNRRIETRDISRNRQVSIEVGRSHNEEEINLDNLSKEERLEKAKEIMEQKDPVELDLDTGEIERLNETTLVERTDNGFCLYHITDK